MIMKETWVTSRFTNSCVMVVDCRNYHRYFFQIIEEGKGGYIFLSWYNGQALFVVSLEIPG